VKPLKNLSAAELSKILNEAQAELQRRENAAKAEREIQAVLQKYNVNIADLDFSSRKGKTLTKKVQTSAEKKSIKPKRNLKEDKRAAVVAKYKNPSTGDKWTGRGRAPAWVAMICEAEEIDIIQFKADQRFRI
jgi:DNA-binding protein H-NS